MSNIKIDLAEEKLLEFDIDIRNDSSVSTENSEVRFVIEGAACSFQFEAKHNKEGGYTVSLPPLKSVFRPGEMKCMVEVIVNERIFKPWEETVEFVETMKVEAKLATKKPRNVQVKARLKRETKKDSLIITDEKGRAIVELENKPKRRVKKPVKRKLR